MNNSKPPYSIGCCVCEGSPCYGCSLAPGKIQRGYSHYRHRYPIYQYCTSRPTPDDWHPTFEDGTVEIHFSAYEYDEYLDGKFTGKRKTETWISFWGNDDFSLIKRFKSLEEAKEEFSRLPLIIFQDDLRNRGFTDE